MGIAIPPRIQEQIDEVQQWAISACYQALQDYGYPSRFLDPNRVAVILGNAMGGEKHYLSTIRIHLPEYIDSLSASPAFKNLSPEVQSALVQGLSSGVHALVPAITEDTMPGELSNIIAGRVANVFNFTGPNYVTDAAAPPPWQPSRAHRWAALRPVRCRPDRWRGSQHGRRILRQFSKIGALSPDGSRRMPRAPTASVMGEGTAIFLLKRLERCRTRR